MSRRLLAAIAVSAVAAGCAAGRTGGAVGLARCVGAGAEELVASGEEELRRQCDLKVGAGSWVVAFPAGIVMSRELRAAGLSDDDLRALSRLELGDSWPEKINVLPAERAARASRTTYHRRFVRTPELLVCRTRGTEVTVVLRRDGERVAWVGLE